MSKKQKQHQMIVPGNALAVHVAGTEFSDLSIALKTWKRKVKDADILDSVKNRKEFIKPSVTKRQAKQRAQYIQRMEDLRNN
mgnify:CR=1 FL=1|jgi:ribosomal protein S21